jgi:hypothetical protein
MKALNRVMVQRAMVQQMETVLVQELVPERVLRILTVQQLVQELVPGRVLRILMVQQMEMVLERVLVLVLVLRI